MRIGHFTAHYRLTLRQVSLLENLVTFYTHERIRDILVPVSTQNAGISLRALDWLVTNFSKKNGLVIPGSKDGDLINVHQEYRGALAFFRRRNFDPFRRRLRITYVFEDNTYETTIAQLNFMRWAYDKGILEFARIHRSTIEMDMQRGTRKGTAQGCPRRREITQPPRQKVAVYIQTSVVTFDGM